MLSEALRNVKQSTITAFASGNYFYPYNSTQSWANDGAITLR